MKKIHNFYFPDWDTHFQDFFNTNIGYQEPQRNRALSFVEDFGALNVKDRRRHQRGRRKKASKSALHCDANDCQGDELLGEGHPALGLRNRGRVCGSVWNSI